MSKTLWRSSIDDGIEGNCTFDLIVISKVHGIQNGSGEYTTYM